MADDQPTVSKSRSDAMYRTERMLADALGDLVKEVRDSGGLATDRVRLLREIAIAYRALDGGPQPAAASK